MLNRAKQDELFRSVSRDLLRQGRTFCFTARGASMWPAIADGDTIHVAPLGGHSLRSGDVVLFTEGERCKAHRIVRVHAQRNELVTRGDNGQESDGVVRADQVLGRVVGRERRTRRGLRLQAVSGPAATWRAGWARLRRSAGLRLRRWAPALLAGLLLTLLAPGVEAQLAFNAATSLGQRVTNAANTLTFAHTPAGANRLLIVGVSINTNNNNGATVSSVTFGGTPLTNVGIILHPNSTRRVEMWRLIAPAAAAANVVVTINLPGGAGTLGVVAGAVSFTGADQNVPLGTFVSNTGNNANPTVNVASAAGEIVLDTMAAGGNRTISAFGAGQTFRWNLVSNAAASGATDVRGAGTTEAGAAVVTMSETLSATSDWAIGAIAIKPVTANMSIVKTASPLIQFLAGTVTFTLTVSNGGPSGATNVTVTDTIPAALTLVSATPSQGSCAGNPIVTCPLGAIANGGTATVTIVATAATAGSVTNTATVAATEADPVAANNTSSVTAVLQSRLCATPGKDGTPGAALTGVINTYFPGTANAAAGATSISVGASSGAVAFVTAGDLLLVMQMQDAAIDSSNTVAYGNGATGSGFTNLNNSGIYEYVRATASPFGGVMPIAGAGAGGGLLYAYTNAAATATQGQRRFQVIRVPQYVNATLSSTLTALAWNGTVGGVLAIDVQGTLALGSATVSLTGLGFRGGVGLQMNNAGVGASTDFRTTAPAAYAGVNVVGANGAKGEGIAGTPRWVFSGGTFLNTGVEGYPNGSMARGAPGNAGGGGTDGDPPNNDENSGGGGGGNGGTGGQGGNSWNSNLAVGGRGGAAFPALPNRVALGGGGGAGSRNNSPGDNQASSGSAGGGVVLIRSGALSGTGTITANGAAAYNGTLNDGGGGGGAGGTIVVLANSGLGGLTANAVGGRGGDAWNTMVFSAAEQHGPGGGGAGGVVILSAAAAATSVAGGTNGLTLNPGTAFGATAGTAGTSSATATSAQITGAQSGVNCTPDLVIVKSHAGNFTRGTNGLCTLLVTNSGPVSGTTSGTVTVNDTLPAGLTPTSAIGAGWSCNISGQTVSCTRSDALLSSASYPSITVTVAVTQTAPSLVVNTATVGGGGEIITANSSSTDPITIVSVADLSATNAAAPNPVAAGANITYTQSAINSGPSAALNATFTQNVPANTTFVSISAPAGWTCNTPAVGGTGSITCAAPTLAAGATANFTTVVNVNGGTATGTVISDTVSASSLTPDSNVANNSATANTSVGATGGGDLTVTNTSTPNPVVAGTNITYTQVVTNLGAAAATSATFSQVTPPNTNFQSLTPPAGWACVTPPVSGTGAISCTNPSVASGASGTFTLVLQVNGGTASGTVITDTVTVGAANDAIPANNTATTTNTVAAAGQADLAITTADSPDPVMAGNNINYAHTVTNNGPAAATTASFSQATPVGTTFQSVSVPAGWSCVTPAVGASGTITCTNASFAAGATANIVVAVLVASSTPAGSTINATATVSAVTTDPIAANNSSANATAVITRVDLAVTNAGTPSPVTAGSNITYTQVVTNNGPSDAASATFVEVTPPNTTFQSITPPAGWSCSTPGVGTAGTISCSNPSLAAGASSSFTVVLNVNGGTAAGTIIADTVTVGSSSNETLLGNNTAISSIAVAVAGQADLSVTNTSTPSPVLAGNNITYTQVVTNSGPAAATSAVFNQSTPANTTFQSIIPPAGWACTTPPVNGTGVINCTNPSVASGASGTFTLVLGVNANTAFGTTITDTVTVSAATGDPNPGNNSAIATNLVDTLADLAVTTTDAPDPVLALANITYTQTVTNNGPSAATAATFTQVIPANTNFQSLVPPAGWTCSTPGVGASGTISCTNPSFAPAAVANFPVVVQVNAGTPAGTIITNTVTAAATTTDNVSANNTASTTTAVATAGQADMQVTNSASPNPVTAGSNITLTQVVRNNGPAAATTATFTQNTPPNTTFQSVTPPAGWVCVPPVIGTAGTISCTNPNVASGASGTFTVVVQVNAVTPSGTVIPSTVTVGSAVSDPNAANNSATATTVVAFPGSANLSITKSGAPNPVRRGNNLTYTLVVTNGGPSTATGVIVTDPLPSAVTFVSATATVGTCGEAGGTVTCLVGSLANAASSIITIVVTATTSTSASNTATVAGNETDPTLANNSATAVTLITAPTAVKLLGFRAQAHGDRVVLRWRTGGERNNLGFHVYREAGGTRVRLNDSLVAGSALRARGISEKQAGTSYAWLDRDPRRSGAIYWLEDVDVNGTRTLHGPFSLEPGAAGAAAERSQTLEEMAAAAAQKAVGSMRAARVAPSDAGPQASGEERDRQFALASQPAVKISVDREGWYRVTQAQLLAAGLDPQADPSDLQLFAGGSEVALSIAGATVGRGGFGPGAAVEFYGLGLDTPHTALRTYWLVEGRNGRRIAAAPVIAPTGLQPLTFLATSERRDRVTYFAALLNGEADNFFGPLVVPAGAEQTILTTHVGSAVSNMATLDIALQGVTTDTAHDVAVSLNGMALGQLQFHGQARGEATFGVPPGLLREGANTVHLAALNGDADLSLVAVLRISYPRTFAAEAEGLRFAAAAGDAVRVTGFTSAPTRVLDVTDASHPQEVPFQVVAQGAGFAADVVAPGLAMPGDAPRTLLALAAPAVMQPAGLAPNEPSRWHQIGRRIDSIIIAPAVFADAVQPLLQMRRRAGLRAALVLAEDLYDEFTFGEKNPQAIREFMLRAVAQQPASPPSLLLVGDASVDPRNFLGLGSFDFLPTKLIDTAELQTASDDWFSDVGDTGFAQAPTGRLPVRTAAEAATVVQKIVGYAGTSGGTWAGQDLLIADRTDGYDFAAATQSVRAALPATQQVTEVLAGNLQPGEARDQILAGINSGKRIVNYMGHGSVEVWSGGGLFSNTDAATLSNGGALPVFIVMNCLNGFFHDVYTESLGEALLLAPGGGAVAVWASSGLTGPDEQTAMNQRLIAILTAEPNLSLGEAVRRAKVDVLDPDVRRTFVLFGDPAMQVKSPPQPGAGGGHPPFGTRTPPSIPNRDKVKD